MPPQQPPSPSLPPVIPLLLSLIIGFGGGFVLGKGGVRLSSNQSGEIEKLQSQIDSARKFFPPAPKELHSIGGVVKNINGSVITIQSSVGSPFDDTPKERMVTITPHTKIILLTPKDPATIKREMTSSQDQMRTTQKNKPPTTLSPYQETIGSITDIKQNQFITATANDNIRDTPSFEAQEIRLMRVLPVRGK